MADDREIAQDRVIDLALVMHIDRSDQSHENDGNQHKYHISGPLLVA
jgi:hypothetical protein